MVRPTKNVLILLSVKGSQRALNGSKRCLWVERDRVFNYKLKRTVTNLLKDCSEATTFKCLFFKWDILMCEHVELIFHPNFVLLML